MDTPHTAWEDLQVGTVYAGPTGWRWRNGQSQAYWALASALLVPCPLEVYDWKIDATRQLPHTTGAEWHRQLSRAIPPETRVMPPREVTLRLALTWFGDQYVATYRSEYGDLYIKGERAWYLLCQRGHDTAHDGVPVLQYALAHVEGHPPLRWVDEDIQHESG